MVPFLFQGRHLQPLPCGGLWWAGERTLLVADLHLEKASFFARHGQFLPPYDSHETALRLARRVEDTGAERVVCLGDSFHDAYGAAGFGGEALAILQRVSVRTEWIWITGNHDDTVHFPFGNALAEMELAGVMLRHEAIPHDNAPEISGHFHPKLRVRHKGRNISRRCFLASERKIIMPAFGALTGGLDARAPAIHAAMRGAITALVPSGGQLLRFPVEPLLEQCA